jgi:hypothetical protein
MAMKILNAGVIAAAAADCQQCNICAAAGEPGLLGLFKAISVARRQFGHTKRAHMHLGGSGAIVCCSAEEN